MNPAAWFDALFARITHWMDTRGLMDNGQIRRDRLTTAAFGIALALATTSFVPSSVYFYQRGDFITLGFYTAVFIFLGASVFGKGLSTNTRAWMGLTSTMCLGLYNQAMFGLASSGRIYMFAVPIFAAILLRPRLALALTGVNVLALSAMGLSMHWGVIPWPGGHAPNNGIVWIITSATFFFLSTVVSLCLLLVMRAMELQLILQKQAKDRLQHLLSEKEVLLREVHHRVKNNLQVVTSLLHLQAQKVTNEQDAALFREHRARIASMAAVHERLYLQPDLAHIEANTYLRGLCKDVTRGVAPDRSPPLCNITGPGLTLDVDTAVTLGLLSTELVINSCKHAFPDGRRGQIDISLTRGKGKAKLVVADNGVGLPGEFDTLEGEGLGMSIVNALVSQLEGTLRVENAEPGAQFIVEFALNEVESDS